MEGNGYNRIMVQASEYTLCKITRGSIYFGGGVSLVCARTDACYCRVLGIRYQDCRRDKNYYSINQKYTIHAGY